MAFNPNNTRYTTPAGDKITLEPGKIYHIPRHDFLYSTRHEALFLFKGYSRRKKKRYKFGLELEIGRERWWVEREILADDRNNSREIPNRGISRSSLMQSPVTPVDVRDLPKYIHLAHKYPAWDTAFQTGPRERSPGPTRA